MPNYSLDTYYAKIIPSIIYQGLRTTYRGEIKTIICCLENHLLNNNPYSCSSSMLYTLVVSLILKDS